jgi:hypothetical protein
MRTGGSRRLRFLCGQLFSQLTSAGERARSANRDCVPPRIVFAEVVAASTVLDFGGLLVEIHMSPNGSAIENDEQTKSVPERPVMGAANPSIFRSAILDKNTRVLSI